MILTKRQDRDWETWGKRNPYFGVIADSKFLRANLNDDSLDEFFASGEHHVEHVYRVIRANVRPDFQPVRALDYGCGVGRLVVPLAKRSQEVVGIDVSPSMLVHARENCEKFGAVSARLMHVDEMGSLAPASFDLVHCALVFQHIPTSRGELILRKLIDLLAEGGVGAIHFPYSDTRSALERGIWQLSLRIGLLHGLLNLVRHRPFSSPRMEGHTYSMNRIFDILLDSHCSSFHVEVGDMGGGPHPGKHAAMLYFQKFRRPAL
jgi:SAM-dependent methyltransferase